MTRVGARMKLREVLGPIMEQAQLDFDVLDNRAGLMLLQRVEGRSFELASALVVEAGLELTSDLEEIYLDEEPTE